MFWRLFLPFSLLLWSVLAVLALAALQIVDPPDTRFLLLILLGLAAVAGTLAGAVISGNLARRLSRPLRELIEVADRISTGPCGQRVFLDGPDELGQLGRTFNLLSERLAIRIAQLEEDRQQLRTILSGMVEGVVALDAEQRILFVNERAGQLLEFSTPGPIGRRFWEVVRQRPLLDVVQRALALAEPLREEFNWNGTTARSLTVHAARLPGWPPRGAVLVLHDTTELRRLERLRQDFVANVSHELKTPLSVIKANVETLLDGAIDDAQHRGSFLRQIASQSDRLLYLILDLISLARIESGEELFEFDAVPLEPVVSACLERHHTRAEGRQQNLRVLAPADGREVLAWADEEALDQILDNLLDNAVKYTPEGGEIRVGWRAQGDVVCLEVADTGIGIPEADLPRIFERFYRVDKARSREMGGTGLGLSIVKHLVQALNGTVSATSRVGAGTTFLVCLPRAIQPVEAAVPPDSKSPSQFHRIYTKGP
jgi:two-component system phosphate regulon sensor histidine kinase PhoR